MDQVLPSGGKIVERNADSSAERSSQVFTPTEGGFPRPQRLNCGVNEDINNARGSVQSAEDGAAAGSRRTSPSSPASGGRKVSLFQQRRMNAAYAHTTQQRSNPSDESMRIGRESSHASNRLRASGSSSTAESQSSNGSLYRRLQRHNRLAKEMDPDQIHQENAARIQQMTDEERQELLSDVFSRFSPEMLQSWSQRLRGSSTTGVKESSSTDQNDGKHMENSDDGSRSGMKGNSREKGSEQSCQRTARAPPPPHSSKGVTFSPTESLGEPDPSSATEEQVMEREALTAEGDIDMSRLPQQELEKLQWTRSPEQSNARSNEPRFHLDGYLIPAGSSSNETELYHHGDDPTSPGYTLNELVYLAGSTMPNQRGLALKTLSSIMWNRREAIKQELFSTAGDSDRATFLKPLPQGIGPLILSSLLDMKEISDSCLKAIVPGKAAIPQHPAVSRAAISTLAAFVCCTEEKNTRFGDECASFGSSCYALVDTFMGHALPPPLLSPQATQSSCVSDLMVSNGREGDGGGISLSSFSSLFVDDPVLAIGKLPQQPFQALLNRLTVLLSLSLQPSDSDKEGQLDNSVDAVLKIITSLCLRHGAVAERVLQHRLPQQLQQNVKRKPNGLIASIQQVFDFHLTGVSSQGKRSTSIQWQVLSSCMDVFLALLASDKNVARALAIDTGILGSVRRIIGMMGVLGLDFERSTHIVSLLQKAIRVCRLSNLHGIDLSSWLYWIQFAQSEGLFRVVDLQKPLRSTMQLQFTLLAESMCHSVLSKLQDPNTPSSENAEILADLSNMLLPIQKFAFTCIRDVLLSTEGRGCNQHGIVLLTGCLRLIVALSELLISNNVSVALTTQEDESISCQPCLCEQQEPIMYYIEHHHSLTTFQASVYWCLTKIWRSSVFHDALAAGGDLDSWSLELLSMWVKLLNMLGPNGSWIFVLSPEESHYAMACHSGVFSSLRRLLDTASEETSMVASQGYGSNCQLDFGEALHLAPMQLCYFRNRRLWLVLSYTISRMFIGGLAGGTLSKFNEEELWRHTVRGALTALSACIPSEEAIAASFLKDIVLAPISLQMLFYADVGRDGVTKELWDIILERNRDSANKEPSAYVSKWKRDLEEAFVRLIGSEEEINNSVCIFRCEFLDDFSHLQATWPRQRWDKKAYQQQESSKSASGTGSLAALRGYSNTNSSFDADCAGLPLVLNPSWILWPLKFVVEEFRNNLPSGMDIMDEKAAFSLTELIMSCTVFVCGTVLCKLYPIPSLTRALCKGVLETSLGLGLIPLSGHGRKLDAAMRLLIISSEMLHGELSQGSPETLGQVLQVGEPYVETDHLESSATFSEPVSVAADLISHWNQGICVESHTELAIAWLFRLDVPTEIRTTVAGGLLGDVRGMRFGQSLADIRPGTLGSPSCYWFRIDSGDLRSFEQFGEAYKTLQKWASSVEFGSLRECMDPRDIFLYCMCLLIIADGLFSESSKLTEWTKANGLDALMEARNDALVRDLLQCIVDYGKVNSTSYGIHDCVRFDKGVINERYKVIERLYLKYQPRDATSLERLTQLVNDLSRC
eukprot:gb/GECG01002643.1/.p1 GENE.gb/GECG01002643.1/~~gb/GECG01002643.1/.p1  ORF type:complete len:1555 (+),score=187.29 gb/GECG01002643.1/:1-4665(+)